MKNSSVELVEQVVRLIENSLNEPLLLDNIACSVFVSKYHLHRLFKAVTGKTLMAYVRGRRLSRSLNDLLNTEERLSYIAEKYGFNYEQSYERAFRSQFGVTPTAFRNTPKEIEIIHMLDTCNIRDIANGIFVAPRFVVLPEMAFAGIRHSIPLNPMCSTLCNQAALRFINIEREKIQGKKNMHYYYGVTNYDDGNSYCYMPCVEIIEMENQPKPFESLLLSTNLYAVFRYVGFHSAELLSDYTLNEIFHYIMHDWCSKTAYKRENNYILERIDARVCTSTYCEMDIFLPVNDKLKLL